MSGSRSYDNAQNHDRNRPRYNNQYYAPAERSHYNKERSRSPPRRYSQTQPDAAAWPEYHRLQDELSRTQTALAIAGRSGEAANKDLEAARNDLIRAQKSYSEELKQVQDEIASLRQFKRDAEEREKEMMKDLEDRTEKLGKATIRAAVLDEECKSLKKKLSLAEDRARPTSTTTPTAQSVSSTSIESPYPRASSFSGSAQDVSTLHRDFLTLQKEFRDVTAAKRHPELQLSDERAAKRHLSDQLADERRKLDDDRDHYDQRRQRSDDYKSRYRDAEAQRKAAQEETMSWKAKALAEKTFVERLNAQLAEEKGAAAEATARFRKQEATLMSVRSLMNAHYAEEMAVGDHAGKAPR